MKRHLLVPPCLAAVLAVTTLGPAVQSEAATVPCTQLAGVKVPATVIGLPTTGAEVTGARMVEASGEESRATGPYCRVEASIHPVDRSAPDITVQVNLPTRWNGRAMMFGGGFDGVIPDITANVPYGAADQRTPLGRGYVTFASDSGHQATQADLPSPVFDASFGLNDEAVRNFAGGALKDP
ncbi:hypothetical protein ABIE67_000503 [Streptomyces sp. V4I8]